jgi:hypothetical protein
VLLPTTWKNDRRCRQRREHFSAFWATKRKNFQRRGQQRRRIATMPNSKTIFEPLYLERDSFPNLRAHFAINTQCLSEKMLRRTLFSFFLNLRFGIQQGQIKKF